MQYQHDQSRRISALKWTCLLFLVVYLLRSTPTTLNLPQSPSSKSPFEYAKKQRQNFANIGSHARPIGAMDTAQHWMQPQRRRWLPNLRRRAAGLQRDNEPLPPVSEAACAVNGFETEKCKNVTINSGTGSDGRHSTSSELYCIKIFGLSFACSGMDPNDGDDKDHTIARSPVRSSADVRYEHPDIPNHFRQVHVRNSRIWYKNATFNCAYRPPYNGTARLIQERMEDPCTKKNPIFRTPIDNRLPPKECELFSGKDLARCLEISTNRAPLATSFYILLGSALICALVLLVFQLLRCRKYRCIRGRLRYKSNFSSKRSSVSGKTTPQYVKEPRTLGGNGFVTLLPDSDQNSEQHNRNRPITTLDGANDGWTRWILKKSSGEYGQRRYSPTPKSRPPRIPSLNLPEPSLATVRKASGLGLDPESVPRAWSAPSKKRPVSRIQWGLMS